MHKEGIIIKGIAGFYYVKASDGNVVECKARGRFRNENITPVVGDKVTIDTEDSIKGVIDEIHERKSLLLRPVVSNVDQAFIVFSLKKPQINYLLLDKLLLLAEHNNIEAIICINKSDLIDDNEFIQFKQKYNKIGYNVIKTNGHSQEGISALKAYMNNKISVFVGPSGVGKSTLYNLLQDKVRMETGKISDKVDRGKHTTRHAELIEVEEGSYLVDTPGFSSMNIDFIEPNQLQYVFKEFDKYLNNCKYTSCLHDKESGCRIKQAVSDGDISQTRYETYVSLLNELQTQNAFRRNKR